jgi:hypothetical protein
MTITDGYCTLQELKAYMGITTVSNDVVLEVAINTASRAIDQHCGRRFAKDTSATARTFEVVDSGSVDVDDFWTTTGLVVKSDDDDDGTFEITWAASEYELKPANGMVSGLTGFPYWRIRAVEARRFPTITKRTQVVQVTAQWGWNAVPSAVYQSCLELAKDAFKAREATSSILGNETFGIVRIRQSAMVSAWLEPYCRHDRRGLVAG